VSALDARIGSARAVAIAVVRRTAYFAWRRRMRYPASAWSRGTRCT
jgi:hypothetical protein